MKRRARPIRATLRLVVALPALFAAPAAARAGTPDAAVAVDPANRSAAQKKAARATELLATGRWAEAYEALKAADDLAHAPTFTLAMAQCQSRLGKLLAARALYERVLAEAPPPGAPDSHRDAFATAQRELPVLVKRIPTLTIKVSGEGAWRAWARVDGVKVTLQDYASGRPIDPGAHTVAAEADGGLAARLTVTIAEGATQQVALTLAPGPAAYGPGPLWIPLSEFGLAGVAAAVGAITGVAALDKNNDIRSRCRMIGIDLHCPAADRGGHQAAAELATASNVAFLIAGLATIAGTTLAVIRPGGSGVPPVLVTLGPGALSLRGQF